jgi:Nitrile hydratase beta subunit, C-terminal
VTFSPGQAVRVADRPGQGHHRTPGYVKGRTGLVERLQGTFTNPETRAYGGDGLPEQRLYRVWFAQHDLWPAYDGPDDDRLSLDLFEHWLEEIR